VVLTTAAKSPPVCSRFIDADLSSQHEHILRATIYGAVFIVVGIGWALMQIQRSPYVTYAGVVKPQPVPFSHQHHVTDWHRLPLLSHVGGSVELSPESRRPRPA